MDLRVEKTLRNIRETFVEIAQEKPADTITVKELCERALINKTTFYSHYKNITQLLIELEDDYIDAITGKIDFANIFFTDPETFLLKLWTTYQANPHGTFLLRGRRGYNLLSLLISALHRSVKQAHPNLKYIQGADIALTFCVYGVASIAPIHRDQSLKERAKQSGRIISAIAREYNIGI
jgi:AcrR family transcriptional regulator